MKADSVSKGSQTCRTAVVTPIMTTQDPADIVSSSMSKYRLQCTTGNPPVVHTAEFRLLSFNFNPERHRVDINCFSQGQCMKAILELRMFEALEPFAGKTVWIDYSQLSSGYEPLLCIYRLGAVQKAQNPLFTYIPLWLDDEQKDLFGEFVRLVNLLDEPYRDLVLEVFRDDQVLEAFLDRPASLGFHHNTQGGLLAHTVEVALDCEQACKLYPTLNASLVITSALLHDIGKCQEYQKCDAGRHRYSRSQMGELEMHKTQGVRVVSLAANQCQTDPLMVSEICHAIMAANGPEYMGLPFVKMAEAALVQNADSRSSSINQFETNRASKVNFAQFGGQYMVPASLPVLAGHARCLS